MEFSSVILGGERGRYARDNANEQPENETESGIFSDNSNNGSGSVVDITSSDDTFLTVLDALRQYDVPSIDIQDAIGTTNATESKAESDYSENHAPIRYSHALGGGYSAKVVQHAVKDPIFANITADDMAAGRSPKLLVRAGTVVALKKISPHSAASRASEAFRTICQELKVCFHPLLRQHENIATVLYIGWQRWETFPWMALELAAFGTLEDVLVAPGEGPTVKQKSNLTVDIALGVAALHHVGFVHGDLKPANILVQHHSQRQIVGQVADFGGSVQRGQGAPLIGTPLWCAPEVCMRRSNVKWELADTWVYGLIVASIWSHVPAFPHGQTSCSLDKHVPKCLVGGPRDARVLLLKTELDHWPGSMIAKCSNFPTPILEILRKAFCLRVEARTTLETLVSCDLDAICSQLGRTVSIEYAHRPVPAPLRFKVWAQGYQSRELEYQQIVYEHLLEATTELRDKLQKRSKTDDAESLAKLSLPPESQQGLSPDASWFLYANSALRRCDHTGTLQLQASAAFQVAMSHCLQLGVELDEKQMISYANIAARGGHHQALWVAPLLAYSCRANSGDRAYYLGCLVIGACIGSRTSLTALRSEDPGLYVSTHKAIQSRIRPMFPGKHEPLPVIAFMNFVNAPPRDPCTFSLMDTIRSQNIERSRWLLDQNSTNLTFTDEVLGMNALHALSYLRDEDTTDLASLAHMNGASLGQSAIDSEQITVFTCGHAIEGTAIYWAASKGLTKLFKELLKLYEETSTMIYDLVPMMMQIASLHHHEILSTLLAYCKQSAHAMSGLDMFDSEQDFLQALLGASLTTGINAVSRRLLHGPSYYTNQLETTRVLLREGAQGHLQCPSFLRPTQNTRFNSAITLSIANDADGLLSLLMTKGELAADDTKRSFVTDSILQLCVVENALKCFMWILATYPQLADSTPKDGGLMPTMTPLIMAARVARPEYAHALLVRGANKDVYHKNFSALARAVVDGHLETAEVIYCFSSEAERERTFGYNDTTGATLTGRVMSAWATRRRTKALVNAMEWIDSKHGAYFETTNNGIKQPVWGLILDLRAPSSIEHVDLDTMMLRTLFDMFPKKLEQPDAQGMLPIHLATMNGHYHAIEMLLSRGVDVNAETIGGSKCPQGLTAFAIVMHRLDGKPPFDISNGGKVEIRRWRETMQNILQLLLSKDARIGERYRSTDFWRSLQYTTLRVNVMTPKSVDQDDETARRERLWPQKLPSDETSSEHNRREGGELMSAETKRAMRTIIPAVSKPDDNDDMSREERQDLADYGAWLQDQAKARRRRHQQSQKDDLLVDEYKDYLSALPTSWQLWHTFPSPSR